MDLKRPPKVEKKSAPGKERRQSDGEQSKAPLRGAEARNFRVRGAVERAQKLGIYAHEE